MSVRTTENNRDERAGRGDVAERAVREYLMWLEDPASLIDHGIANSMRGRLASTEDPVEKLRILSAIERVESVDAAGIKEAFRRHAKAYARRENIPPSAFAAMGVPSVDIRAAGLHGETPRRPGASLPRSPRSASRSADEIRAALPEGFFTVREAQQESGASELAVRKLLREMMAAGDLVECPPDESVPARGRAPLRYRRS